MVGSTAYCLLAVTVSVLFHKEGEAKKKPKNKIDHGYFIFLVHCKIAYYISWFEHIYFTIHDLGYVILYLYYYTNSA